MTKFSLLTSVLAVLLASVLSVSEGQAVTEKFFPLYGGPSDPDCDLPNPDDCPFAGFFDISTEVDTVENTLKIYFKMRTDFMPNTQAEPAVAPNAIWIGVVDPTLFCSSEYAGSDCLADPNTTSYPANSFYTEQASRKLFLTFDRTSGDESVNFCGLSTLNEVCSGQISCDNLGWASQAQRNSAIAAQTSNPAIFTDLTNPASRPPQLDYSIGSFGTFERESTFSTYQNVTLTVPNDFFISETDENDRFSLHLDTGAAVFLNWGFVATSVTQDSCTSSTATLSNAGYMSLTPYLSQVLPWNSIRKDLWDASFITTGPPTPAPTQSPFPEVLCPENVQWELCLRINLWWHFLINVDNEKRSGFIEEACIRNGCQWCGFDTVDPQVHQCRPTISDEGEEIPKDMACPSTTFANPYAIDSVVCPFLPNCPTQEEFDMCQHVNELEPRPRYRRRMCQQGGFTVNGTVVPAHTCTYNFGVCRAVGDYWFAHKLIRRIRGFWGRSPRNCPNAPIP